MTRPTDPPPAVPPLAFLTDEALRAVFDRLEELEAHQDGCCGFQRDGCRYDRDYERLYDLLHLAGLPEEAAPLDRPTLDAWLATRPGPAPAREGP